MLTTNTVKHYMLTTSTTILEISPSEAYGFVKRPFLSISLNQTAPISQCYATDLDCLAASRDRHAFIKAMLGKVHQ